MIARHDSRRRKGVVTAVGLDLLYGRKTFDLPAQRNPAFRIKADSMKCVFTDLDADRGKRQYRLNGGTYFLWRAADHAGEVQEVLATKRRDRTAAA